MKRLRLSLSLVSVLWALPTLAGPKVLAVAAGDCRRAELLSGMATFHDELRTRWRDDLFSPELVLDLTRPLPTRTLDDLRRQVESAKTIFYGGQPDRALELVKTALAELEKVPGNEEAWPIATEAYLVQAQAFKAVDRKQESNEAYKRVLRLDGAYKPDPDFFTPSSIAAFDVLRREVQKARKATLQVQTTPPGAEVFIEGRAMGKTPFKQDLPVGTYRVAVALGEQRSFPRSVTLPKDGALHIDLAFEGALAGRTPLCLQGDGPAEGLAQKLALTVGAEKVVVFWNANHDGPPFFKALLSKVGGSRERDAGVESARLLDQLASFIVTGTPNLPAGESAKAVTPAPSPKPVEVVLTPVPTTPTAPAAPLETGAIETLEVASSSARPVGLSAGRVASFVLLGAGGAAAAAGVAVYATGADSRDALSALTMNGELPAPTDPGHRQALDLLPKVDGNQRLAFSLIGAGAGAVVAGLVAFVVFPGSSDAVAVVPTSSGATVVWSRGW